LEPVTHILTGACLARTGFNRRAAYTTLTMALAAEMPDLDMLWSLKGPVEGFTHHRGITHTFVALPVEAAILVGAVYLLHRWRVRRPTRTMSPSATGARPQAAVRDGAGSGGAATAAPVRWGTLYLFALVGLLSHLLLDWTNNYGIRPFFPFNPRWYAGSFVFIVDPVILLLLLGGLVLPSLFGLIGSEVGARRQRFRGRGWAVAALAGVVALWTLRLVEHQRAVDLTMAQTMALPLPPGAPDDAVPQYVQPLRALASPSPMNPLRWTAVADLGPVYQLAEVDLQNDAWTADQTMLPKPPHDAAALAAYRSPLGRAYFDWSPMPIVSTDSFGSVGETLVTLRDPRFMGGWLKDHGNSGLTATVLVRANGSVAWQAMDGRTER
jgi:inner membrane protein